MIGTDAGTPLICRDSAYLQGLRLFAGTPLICNLSNPVRSLAENNPGRGRHHYEQDQGDPEHSEQGKHDASPPYRENLFRETCSGKYGGLLSPYPNPQVGAGAAPLDIVGVAPLVHKTFCRAETGRRGPVG